MLRNWQRITNVDGIVRDFEFALRQLRRGRGSSVASTLTIAVGIAVTTVMLSVVDVVLLRGLPYRDADRLVSVELTTARERGTSPHGSLVPYELFQAWQRSANTVQEFAAHSLKAATYEINGETHEDLVVVTSANLFSFLGRQPALGRAFVAAEDFPGSTPVVVLSYQFWKKNFGGDSAAIGRRLRLSGKNYTIIGVMPQGFRVPNTETSAVREDGEFWLPLGVNADSAHSEAVNVLAILNRGSTANAVQADLDRISALLDHPDGATLSASDARAAQVLPLQRQVMAELEQPVKMLCAAVLCVVVIICANTVGLQLSRINARKAEFSLRVALGASQIRIARLVFVEHLILAITGGVIGVMLAVIAFPATITLFGRELPTYLPAAIDLRVLALVSGAIIGIGTVTGAASSWLVTHGTQRLALTDGQPGTGTGRERTTLGNAIVVGEVALTMLMLAFTGLLTRSYLQLTESSRGYDARGTTMTFVNLPDRTSATDAQLLAFTNEILQRVRQLPGVRAVAAAQDAPLTTTSRGKFDIENDAGQSQTFQGQFVFVTPAYFETLGMQVLRGRVPTDKDLQPGYVIDQAAATKYFGAANPIGKTIRREKNGGTGTIVGIVNTFSEVYSKAKGSRYRSKEAHVYVPLPPSGYFALLVRTDANVNSLAPAINRVIREVNPRTIITSGDELHTRITSRYSRDRILAQLSIAFAIIGLLVAAGGVYAIISCGVAQRTREFGIRMALGAQSLQLMTLTLKRGLYLAAAGIVLGLISTVAMSRLVRSMLFEVSPVDPASLVFSAVALVSAALLASYLPARRASRLEVVTALRDQ